MDMSNPNGSPARLTIPLVVVERTYADSIRIAVERINERYKLNLRVPVYITADMRSAADWERLAADLAQSCAVFLIHLTQPEIYERVISLIKQEDEHFTAIIPFNSTSAVMRLARLGSLNLGRMLAGEEKSLPDVANEEVARPPKRGLLATLGGIIRSSPRRRKTGEIESYARIVSALPTYLRFLPGQAQDIRTYLLLYTYYLNSSAANLENMLLYTIERYITGYRSKLKYAAPVEYPMSALYHPNAPKMFTNVDEYLHWYHHQPGAVATGRPRVGLLLFRSFVLNANTRHYDAVIRALERRGLIPLPALCFGMDNRLQQEQFFTARDKQTGKLKPLVEAVVTLTGFGYVGGMGANDAPAAIEALAEMNVPYLDMIPLTFQRIEEWQQSETGLNPLQTAMQIAIPELEGATTPVIYAGVARDGTTFQPLNERIEQAATRIARVVALRTKPNAEKRVAITLFSFPPNRGSLGTAAYLDVFAGIYKVMQKLKAHGYRVDMPESSEALRAALLGGNAEIYGTCANVATTIDMKTYWKLWPHAAEIEKVWGPAPGSLNSDGKNLLVLGRHFGNIFVGVQPSFGYEGDPMRLLFQKGLAPHHGFAAFYLYLDRIWNADAVLHFGTHGALEFMPGKQTGLSSSCWPDRLIGTLPHFYYYSAGNPSEGTIARRRSYATLLSYLTPPLQHAGLYREMLTLKDLIAAYRRARSPEEARELYMLIKEQAEQANLV